MYKCLNVLQSHSIRMLITKTNCAKFQTKQLKNQVQSLSLIGSKRNKNVHKLNVPLAKKAFSLNKHQIITLFN